MPIPDAPAAAGEAAPAYGFLWLTGGQAWYTFLWILLLALCAVLWAPAASRPGARLALACSAVLGLTLVAPAVYTLTVRFAGSRSVGSDLAMAIFGIVATLISGYSLYVATVVDRKRDQVEQNMTELNRLIGELRSQNVEQREDLARTREQLTLQDLRIALFLTVTDEIETLDEDGSTLSRNRAMTLRLVQRLLSRRAFAEVVFDLRELTTVLHRRPAMVSTELKARIRTYLELLIRCRAAADVEHIPFVTELSQRLVG